MGVFVLHCKDRDYGQRKVNSMMYIYNIYYTDLQHIDKLYDVHIRKCPLYLHGIMNILSGIFLFHIANPFFHFSDKFGIIFHTKYIKSFFRNTQCFIIFAIYQIRIYTIQRTQKLIRV